MNYELLTANYTGHINNSVVGKINLLSMGKARTFVRDLGLKQKTPPMVSGCNASESHDSSDGGELIFSV